MVVFVKGVHITRGSHRSHRCTTLDRWGRIPESSPWLWFRCQLWAPVSFIGDWLNGQWGTWEGPVIIYLFASQAEPAIIFFTWKAPSPSAWCACWCW